MNDIIDLQKKITLKATAPSTFYINLFASLTHIGAGASFFLFPPETRLNLVGVLPLKVWAIIFISHGIIKLFLLPFADVTIWKYIRAMMLVAIIFDIWWLMEAVSAILVYGLIGVLVLVASLWFFLITTQISGYLYFTPQIDKTERIKNAIE